MTRLLVVLLFCFSSYIFSQPKIQIWERVDLNNAKRVNYKEFSKSYDILVKNIIQLLNKKEEEILKVDVLDGKTFFIISRADTKLPLDIGIIYISKSKVCDFDLSFKVLSPKSPEILSGKIFDEFRNNFNKVNVDCSKNIPTPSKNSRSASP